MENAEDITLALRKSRDNSTTIFFQVTKDDINITHELPIEVCSKSTEEAYSQPNVPSAEIGGDLLFFKQMKIVVEKMSEMADEMKFTITEGGDVTLRCDMNQNSWSVSFGTPDLNQEDLVVNCMVNIKHFKKYFVLDKSNVDKSEYYYIPGQYLILKNIISSSEVSFFVPLLTE